MLEVIHAPRLEDLADALAEQLRAQRRRQVENILQPIFVVVGHLGIARWLEQRFAIRFGIFANVRFVLAGEWLNAEMARFGVLEKQDAQRFALGAMTWSLYALLAAPERFGLLADKPLLERERFQLAAKLARLFSEYLIYRREWLLDFEQEAARAPQRHARTGVPAEPKEWQARLWCALSARLKGAHRAANFRALLNAIKSSAIELQPADAIVDAPTYFFGLNHLPPDMLTLLERLSESASVQIYFPNPCVEYWADVVRERFLAQRRLGGDLLRADLDAGGFDHFDVGHPLLASLGGHGQAYFAELSHATAHFSEIETQADAPMPSVLAALQYGITHLQPDFAPASLKFDQSIQVFSADNIVDELSRVKAIVLAALLSDPKLQLQDIAIMTPNLSRYAPLLPAVFGAELCASQPLAFAPNPETLALGPRAQSALRYSVLDLTQASASPLLQQLLQAPELRWEPDQLLALLALDPVAQHFALDAYDLEHAPRLLQRAHIAFGFNDAHRRQLIAVTTISSAEVDALPSASLHTWEAGLERLLFGFLHGNHADSGQANLGQADSGQADSVQVKFNEATSAESLWPVPDIDVRHAPILTALLQLIRALRVFNFGAQRSRSVPDWTRWLDRQMLSFTGLPTTDSVRALLNQLEQDAAHAELGDDVSFAALREACLGAMTQASTRSAPVLGAICVCGLVPMRALPFKLICILGLNEAEFPKPELPDSLNLMRAPGARRPGDRFRAQEDRYLFLEAIMAARSQLVLSYQGVNGDGSARQPCSVLTELLAQLQRQFCARLGGTPWLGAVADARVPSTQKPLGMSTTARLNPHSGTTQRAPIKQTLDVNDLFRFWQQPLRTYVQQHLRVAPQQTDADSANDAHKLEPLGLATPPIERVEAKLLAHALAAGSFPATAPPWLGRSGLLASGALGLQSYANIEQTCRAAWISIKGKFPDFLAAAKQPVRVDLNLGSTRLIGYVPDVYLDQRACVCISSKALHGLQRLRLMLRVLLLRAAETESSDANAVAHSDREPWRALHLGPGAAELLVNASANEARAYLAKMILLRSDYLQKDWPRNGADNSAAPPWFWPKLSYTAFSAKGDAHQAVLQVIKTGKDYELAGSGLKFWLPNADFFDADSPEFAQFLALAQTVFAPFAPSKPAEKSKNVDVPMPLPANPVRHFAVTEAPLPEPTSQTQASPKTLNLEQFGHDDSADFDNEY